MYQEQLARVRRFLERVGASVVRGPVVNQADYEDMLWAFFQNCWHLKDWIQSDRSAPPALRDGIEEAAQKEDVLMFCHDLANRSKHIGPFRHDRKAKKVHEWRAT